MSMQFKEKKERKQVFYSCRMRPHKPKLAWLKGYLKVIYIILIEASTQKDIQTQKGSN